MRKRLFSKKNLMKTIKSQLLSHPLEVTFSNVEPLKEYKQSFMLRNLQNV